MSRSELKKQEIEEMSNDLDEFLRKAAERRLARQNQGNTQAPSQQPTSKVVESALAPSVLEPIASETRQGLGPRLQSNIHSESLLGREIDQADDRARARVHEQFDHTVSRLETGLSKPKTDNQQTSKKNIKKKQVASSKEPQVISSYEESRNDMTIERTASKMIATGSMMELLRNPQTLRTAFIASQIFERKF